MRLFLQTPALAGLLAAFCSKVPVDIASTCFYARLTLSFLMGPPAVTVVTQLDLDRPWQT